MNNQRCLNFIGRNRVLAHKLVVVCCMVILPLVAIAQTEEEMYTIYLVRHAEKEVSSDNPKDPNLTPCGLQRSKSIAEFLDKVDLDMVYSTNYKRTMQTADPTATQKQLEITAYNPRELNAFASNLIALQQNALVVGHSNTTPVLAGLLIREDIPPIDESIYNQIYQVVISKETGQLQLFQSAFVCKEQ